MSNEKITADLQVIVTNLAQQADGHLIQSRVFAAKGFNKLASKYAEHATEERGYVEKFIDRILDLGGKVKLENKKEGVVFENPVDFVKTNLFGIEGKDLDNSEAYFLSTNIPDTNDYKNNKSDFPAITIKVINDSDKLSTTIVFANVPISYIDILKEHDKKFHNVLPAAPITNIVDFLYTEDGKFVKQCIIAASKYGIVEELGQETALGKTQICYENNNTFAAGETFNIAMLAKLAVGQEIVDTYSDINSIDELCTCFDLDNSADEAIDCSTIIWENEEPSEIEELDRDEEELEDDSDEVSENDDCGSRAYWTDAYGCVCYDKNAYFEYYEGCKCRQKYRIENGECVPFTCDEADHQVFDEFRNTCKCDIGYKVDEDSKSDTLVCVEDL